MLVGVRGSVTLRRSRLCFVWIALVAFPVRAVQAQTGQAQVGQAQKEPSPPAASPPTAAQDLAEAKRHFEVGLKLYAEQAYREALGEFEASYRAGHRPSALKNIAQCHRDLKEFADAYEAYQRMLDGHAAQLSAVDTAIVKRALGELSVLSGTLKITVSEPDAAVELDGKPLDTSPLAAPKRVSLGEHTVRVTKTGFEPFEKGVTLGSEQVLEVSAALEHEVLTGHLLVREQNARAVHVMIDGKDMGPAPWEGDLPAGAHNVVATSDVFASDLRTVTVARREKQELVLDATSLLGHLRVTTLPASATISLDGKSVGTGVWDGDLATGPHHIEVSVAGFPSSVRDVTLQRAQTIVEEIPVAAAVAGVSAGPDYRGVYARISPFGMVGTGVPHFSPLSSAPEGPFTSGPSVSQDTEVAFGGTLRVGYSFDILAVELVTTFAFTSLQDHVHYTYNTGATSGSSTTSQDNDVKNQSFNAFAGLGPRVTSHGSTVRFTFGIAPGLMFRHFDVSMDSNGQGNCGAPQSPFCTTGRNNGSSGANAVDFAFDADGGMLIGSTPGAKFFLGVHALLDFAPTIGVGPDTSNPGVPADYYSYPGRGYLAAHGPQLYFGPTLGIQFGH